METRLGDIIDDFCVKCKRVMNHAVVSILDSKPAKVRCRTCYNDHDFRFEQAPPPKVDPRKLALLAAKAAAAASAADATLPVPADGEEIAPVEIATEPAVETTAEPVAEIAAGTEPPTKTRVKARGRR
jgi:hypothetical protein